MRSQLERSAQGAEAEAEQGGDAGKAPPAPGDAEQGFVYRAIPIYISSLRSLRSLREKSWSRVRVD